MTKSSRAAHLLRGSALGAAILLAATLSAAQVAPTPLKFSEQYGSMNFPAKFPDGTTLTITQWSHFVPSYDKWFDKYVEDWGKQHNVKASVQHISLADVVPTLSAAIAAGKGATLFESVSTPASFVEGLQDLADVNKAAQAAFGDQLEVCTSQSFLPNKNTWYGYCHGWVPDPGVYRPSLWKEAGYPNGPATYDELYEGGVKIFKSKGIPVGVGMSPELDSEFYARSLIWSFGGTLFDKCGEVTLDSPEVLKAVQFQAKLFKDAETPEVFSWNAASNNQGYIAGELSYIQNSISFYRTAQASKPEMAADSGFTPGLKGPGGHKALQTSHVWHIYVMPKYVTNAAEIQAAKKFLLDFTNNYSWVTHESQLYDFPAFPKTVPQLTQQGGWLDVDPFKSNPPDKLAVFRNAAEWTAWPGYPGVANPAVSEVYNTNLISTMMADAARGKKTPEQAVKDTARQMGTIVAKWKDKGYVGCAAPSK